MTQIQPIFISVKEAAKMLNLTTWTIYRLLDEKAIQSQYQGKRRLVRLESLRSFADSLPDYPGDAA